MVARCTHQIQNASSPKASPPIHPSQCAVAFTTRRRSKPCRCCVDPLFTPFCVRWRCGGDCFCVLSSLMMQLLVLPAKFLRGCATLTRAWVRVVARQRPQLWPVEQSLPVAGLDVLKAQSVLYSLRQSLASLDEGPEAVDAWLVALQLCQIASDRLLHDMWAAQRSLAFWRARLAAGGSHGVYLLLSRGPGHFAAGTLAAVRRGRHGDAMAPSDRIEERILLLERLSQQLAAALTQAARAADTLRMAHAPPGAPPPAGATNGVAPAAGDAEEQAQRRQLLAATLAAVRASLSGLSAALERLLPEAGRLAQDDALAALRRGALSATLAGSMRVRQPQHAPHTPGGAAAAGASAAPRGGAFAFDGGVGGVGAPASLSQVHALERRVRSLLGIAPAATHEPPPAPHEVPRQHHQHHRPKGGVPRDALAALRDAPKLAAQQGSLVAVPRSAVMPSRFERHWLRFLGAAAAAAWAASFALRHSRTLGGSGDLERWAGDAASTLRDSWRVHLAEPLVALRNEMTSTFRDRPSIVSPAEFEADKQALLRMLDAFQRERGGGGGGSKSALPPPSSSTAATAAAPPPASSSSLVDAAAADAIGRGMGLVMDAYEHELRSPIRSLIAGDLARTLLIQVQRLKIDTEAAMLELDQILRANELSISLVAAVPSLVLLGAALRALWRVLFMRRAPDAKREAVPVRLAMVELERALVAAADAADAVTAVGGGAVGAAAGERLAEAEGAATYKLFKVYREATRVYRLRDRTSRASEWPHLQGDLLALGCPTLPPAAALDLHRRMLRTYTLFQP